MKTEFQNEPERYEVVESPPYCFDVNRRDFLRFAGGGLAVVCLAAATPAQETAPGPPMASVPDTPAQVSSWIRVAENGTVTVYTGKVEIGQNTRTSLAQLVAEELTLPVASVSMVMGDTALTPFDFGTVGSRAIPQMGMQLRRAAASMRELLLELAAQRLAMKNPANLVLADGKVQDRSSGQALTFAELTRGQRLVKTIAESQAVVPATEWKVAGKPLRKVNGREYVTGKERFASDFKRPGMVYGKIIRPAAMDAVLAAVDDRAARRMAGVTVVRDGNFLGVTAPKPWAAEQAAEAIRATWNIPAQPVNSENIYQYLKEQGGEVEPPAAVRSALEQADHKLERSYTVAYIAHVPLEPRAALAEWSGGNVTIWTATQRPFTVQEEVAQAFRIPAERVRIITPAFGSGYGGKHTGEAAVEAARLAKASGKPVKLVWTREEEFQWGYFRPAGVIDIRSGMSRDGAVQAWFHVNYHSGRSAMETLYEVPHAHSQYVRSKLVLRSGSYRALAATANVFARETHMDELAQLAGMDCLEFRLKNLKDERARAVLEAAAKRFGWGAKAASGHGYGLAVAVEKGGYVATCAEVEMTSAQSEPKVIRVVEAFECGAVVNPDGLENQISGAIVQGLGGALFEAVEFAGGRIRNGRLRDYRVPRFTDTPKIEVVILDRKDLPSAGAGETPLVGVAPAVGNAIFAASGERRRSLPLTARKAESSSI
jgi:CO/xanthine dehydrogenase Mo-binding subunit